MVDHENSLYSRTSLGLAWSYAATLPWTTCMGCANRSGMAASRL